jgi:hypothetical protein
LLVPTPCTCFRREHHSIPLHFASLLDRFDSSRSIDPSVHAHVAAFMEINPTIYPSIDATLPG